MKYRFIIKFLTTKHFLVEKVAVVKTNFKKLAK